MAFDPDAFLQEDDLTTSTLNNSGYQNTTTSVFDPDAFLEEDEEEVGTLQGIANSAQNAFDSSKQALLAVGGVDQDQAEQISKLEYAKQARKAAPGYAEYQKAEGMDAVGAFLRNPVEVTTNIIGEGLAGSLPALGAGLTAGAAGAAVGSVVPGIGTGIGFTAGQVAGTFGGSLSTEYGSKILEELQNSGMDITDPNSIQSYFSDEEKLAPIRDKALARGVPIAAFDAVSAGIGGKLGRVFGSEIIKEGEKVLGKKFATKTGEALTELGAQAVLGGGGEVAGSVAAGDEVNLKDVFAEVIGEVGTGSIEVLQGKIADRANQRKLIEAKANQDILNLSETLEQNNAPQTARATTQELAKKLSDDLNVDREKEAVELADLGGQTLKKINEVKSETKTATTKEEVAANLSEEDLNTREQDAKKLVQQYKDAYFESQDPNDRAKAVEFQGVLDAIKAEKQKRKAAPAEAAAPAEPQAVKPLPTDYLPTETPGATYGRESEIYDAFANVPRKITEAVTTPTAEEVVTPTTEDITAVPPVAEAATLPVEQAPLTQQAVAQQVETQPYATQEIIQPESVRQEPQDGTQAQPTAETIARHRVFNPEGSKEEGQVTPVVNDLQSVASNTATPEQITKLSQSGLVDIVKGQPVINEDGQAALTQAQAPLPKLTPTERRAEIEAELVTPTLPKSALDVARKTDFTSFATREEAGDAGINIASQDTSLPPPPPAQFQVLESISNLRNRKPYNPDVLTESAIQEAKNNGWVIGKQVGKLKFTESGRNQLRDWSDQAKSRYLAEASLQDEISDFAVSQWDASRKATPSIATTPSPVAETPAVTEAPAAEPAGISAQVREYATGEPNTPFYWENDSWKVDATRLPNGAEVLESSDGPTVYVRNADGSVSQTGVTVNGRHENIGRIRNNFMPSQFANVPRDEAARALGIRVYESDRLADIFPALDQATAESLVAKYPPTTPSVSETITPAAPTGPQVGQRVRSGSTPQPFVITEVTPQTARDVELGEQYYKIKNERTGEVSTVESVDITPIKTTRSSKKLKAVYPSKGGVEPTGAIQAKAGVSPTMDTEYLAAVESGDMETAQRMVDEAAKAAGYDIRGYHGTRSPIGFTEFIPNEALGGAIFVATEPSEASAFGRVMDVFIRAKNVRKGVVRSYDEVRAIASSKKRGQDAIRVTDGVGAPINYAVFDPTQIKSADPVTYDDAGNVIPLSQRFNKKTPDIRYARARDKAKYRQKYKSIAIQEKVQNYIKIAQDEMQEAIDNKDIELAENIQKNINTAFQYNINESELYTQEDLVKGVANFFNGSIPDNVIFVEDIGFNGYALYNTETGQIEINRAYFKEGKKIDSIIAHELGHYAFGDPVFRKAILDLWNGLTPQAREAISRFVEKNYSDFDPDSRTEEKIIYGWEQIIEANPEVKSSWDKFVQFINYYLNKYIFRGQYVPKNSTKVALDVLNSIRQEFINGKSIIREDGSRFTFEARVTEDRSQVHGNVKAGDIISKVPEFFAKTDKIISDDIFDFTQLNQDNTDKAWSIMESLKDQGFARSINEQVMRKMDSSELDEVNRTVGVQRLKNSLKRYGLKLLAAGDPSFNKAYNKLSNKLSNGLLSDTDTNIATTLGAKERIEDQVSGASEAQTKGEKVQTASTLFGTPSPTKEQIDAVETGLEAAETAENLDIDNILDSVVSAESKTGVNIRNDIDATIKKSGVKQKTVDDVIGSTETGKSEFSGVDTSTAKASIKKQATSPIDAQAERAIEGLAKLQSDVQSWPNKTQNQVRSIVQQDLRQRPDMARKEAWKSLLTSKLMNAGVSESNAMTLSDLVWKQHEINNMNREIKLIESAAENGYLGVIVEMIKNTPLQQQSTPEWRKEVIRRYLMSAGLSEKQAESAARLYDNIIAEKIAEAKQKAFEQSISKTSPWRDHMSRNGQLAKDALKKVLNAVRTSALDPTQNTESIIAKQNGWTGFSEADFRRIAEIDEILNNDKTDELKKAELMKELNEIISKTKLPVTVKQALAAFYTGQALMGIPTGLVNFFSPAGFAIRNLITDIGRFALTDPSRIPIAFDTFLDSMRSWYNQTKYAFKNEVYPNDVVEYLNGNNVLKELYNKGKKEWKNGDYASGMRDMLVGMTQITGRVLSALDQGAISALENQAVNRYAMEAMSLSNIPRSKRNAVARQILQAKRNTYASLIAGGMEKERAGVLADMEMKNEIKTQLSSLNIESEKVNNVINSAINDALLSVGRNRTLSMDGLSNEQKRLSDDGMISYLPIKFLEQIASSSAQQGPLMQVFSKMLYGFALVPARAFHNAAWYSPYGFLRIFRDKYQKSKGMESSYSLSLGNELQYRQRLTESIAGSLVMLGLGALVKSSTDDEDDDKFKIVVTGNGPDAAADKQYYDSWIKKWKPYSIHIVMGDTVIPINIGRGGEAIFFPILMAGALDDWKIRNQMNKAKKKPADLNQATVMLGSAFLALAQRGPYAAFGKSLFNANRAGQLPEEVASQAGYFGKTFIPIVGTSLARNISDFINDPIDRSSMSGAIYSNIPIVGPMIGTKALNAFGQPIRADDWGDKLYKLGVPMVFSFPKNTPMNELNELVLSKGDGPTIPTRRNAEAKLERPMTNEEFYAYVKTYGDYVSKSMFRSRKSLERMDASRYQSQLEEYSKDANERATRTVKRMSMR